MGHIILCVDDEQDNVDALERLFRKNYQVLKATSGKQALSLLKVNPVTVIISDQRMPEMTGVEFLKKSRETHPEAVRILLTGYTDIEAVISAINDGHVYRYVTKPWDSNDLLSAIRQAIEWYDLHAELEIKNKELQEALNELEKLDQTKSHFMILINHELKTPLTTLLSFMDLLKETPLDDEQKKYLDRMAKSAGRLKEIIFDVLELVSAETGRTFVNPEKFDVLDLLKEAINEAEASAQKKTLVFRTKADPSPVRCDRKLLKGVFHRILKNAVMFSEEGSIIEIFIEKKDGDTEVRIQNPAKQIPPDQIARILKPFSVDENIMNHSKGMGLGLSISRATLGLLKIPLNIDSRENLFQVNFRIPD